MFAVHVAIWQLVSEPREYYEAIINTWEAPENANGAYHID